MPESDVASRGPRLRIAVSVKALEHHRLRKFGGYGPDGRIQRQLAAFDLLHSAGAGYRFGHRSDPNDCIRRHRLSRREGALAVAALKNRAVSRRSRGDHAGHVARIGGLLQHCRNFARVGHSRSSRPGWLWRRPEKRSCRLSLSEATSRRCPLRAIRWALDPANDEFYVIGRGAGTEAGTGAIWARF